jgi:hypothetical protein
MMNLVFLSIFAFFVLPYSSHGFIHSSDQRAHLLHRSLNASSSTSLQSKACDRKQFLNVGLGLAFSVSFQPANGAESNRPESLDIDSFLRTGQEAFPMGVSSQAGKSKPVTGIFLRDGTDVLRDSRTGNVLAEIVLGDKSDLSAVLVSFSSPWQLATGDVFDVECRDSKTGDGAFLSVTESTNIQNIQDIPTSFFLENLFAPTGRFSFYGSPTNVKVKKSEMQGDKRVIEFSFANLSQSTNAEIPRTALMVATKPTSVNQAIMLVGSATTNRWKKGAEKDIRETIASFNASLSPKTLFKVRAKNKFDDFKS